MRHPYRLLVLATIALASTTPVAVQARQDCVWFDVHTPVWSGGASPCTPDVLPPILDQNHQPQNCGGIPPADTDWCVGANVWLTAV